MYGIGPVEAGLVPDSASSSTASGPIRTASGSRACGSSISATAKGGFEARQIGVVQALFERSGARREPVLGTIH